MRPLACTTRTLLLASALQACGALGCSGRECAPPVDCSKDHCFPACPCREDLEGMANGVRPSFSAFFEDVFQRPPSDFGLSIEKLGSEAEMERVATSILGPLWAMFSRKCWKCYPGCPCPQEYEDRIAERRDGLYQIGLWKAELKALAERQGSARAEEAATGLPTGGSGGEASP